MVVGGWWQYRASKIGTVSCWISNKLIRPVPVKVAFGGWKAVGRLLEVGREVARWSESGHEVVGSWSRGGVGRSVVAEWLVGVVWKSQTGSKGVVLCELAVAQRDIVARQGNSARQLLVSTVYSLSDQQARG